MRNLLLVTLSLAFSPLSAQDDTAFVPFPETAAYNAAERAASLLEEMAGIVEGYSNGSDFEALGFNAGEALGRAKTNALFAYYLTAIACRRHEDPRDYVTMFQLDDLHAAFREVGQTVGDEAFDLAIRHVAREARSTAASFRVDADKVVRECETPSTEGS